MHSALCTRFVSSSTLVNLEFHDFFKNILAVLNLLIFSYEELLGGVAFLPLLGVVLLPRKKAAPPQRGGAGEAPTKRRRSGSSTTTMLRHFAVFSTLPCSLDHAYFSFFYLDLDLFFDLLEICSTTFFCFSNLGFC